MKDETLLTGCVGKYISKATDRSKRSLGTCSKRKTWFDSQVKFKRNSWLVVLVENVKIPYFSKNSYVYVLVHNNTMKIHKEIKYVNSDSLENIVQ